MTRRDPGERERALHVLAVARYSGISLSEAAARVGVSPRVVLRYAGAGFEQRGGQWRARPRDSISRRITLLTPEGPRAVATRDSRHASLIALHNNAVRRYIETGDTSLLEAFERYRANVQRGPPLEFATDPRVIDRLAEGGELAYDVYLRF